MKNMRKKSVAVLIGLAVTGLVGASAATLGGVESENLGADVGVVASCDTTGVEVAFSTGFDGGIPVVTAVEVSEIAAECEDQEITVTLAQGQNALTIPALTSLVGPTGTESFVLATPVSAEALTRVAITISGTPAP